MNLSAAEILQRAATACQLRQAVDREVIAKALVNYAQKLSADVRNVQFIESLDAMRDFAHRQVVSHQEFVTKSPGTSKATLSQEIEIRSEVANRYPENIAYNTKSGRYSARQAFKAVWDTLSHTGANNRDLRDTPAASAWAVWNNYSLGVLPSGWEVWDVRQLVVGCVVAAQTGNDTMYRFYEPLLVAAEHGAWLIVVGRNEIGVIAVPQFVHVDERSRLHAELGPAIKFMGVNGYFWHGVNVGEEVIMHPESITYQGIEAVRNVEVRRVMIERYGESRYILDSGIAPQLKDEYGELYVKQEPGDEPLTLVHVFNKTPEPDGTYKPYWLKVPSAYAPAHLEGEALFRHLGGWNTRFWNSPREAIAWTFGLEEHEYNPRQET